MAGPVRLCIPLSISFGLILFCLASLDEHHAHNIVSVDFADKFREEVGKSEEKRGSGVREEGYGSKQEQEVIYMVKKKGLRLKSEKNNPLVAVCVTGTVRSLVSPIVYKRLRVNLVESLSANAHVIAIIKAYKDRDKISGVDKLKKWDTRGFGDSNKNLSDLIKPLRYLSPSALRIYSHEEDDFNYTCKLDPKLDRHHYFSRSDNLAKIFLGQMKGLWDCMQEMIKLEKKHNIQFDAIARTRTDSVWLQPIRSAKSLLDDNPNDALHWWDHFIFTPRKGIGIFTSFWDDYINCTDVHRGPYTPEIAFARGLQETGMKYKWDWFPSVVKRISARESTSEWNCKELDWRYRGRLKQNRYRNKTFDWRECIKITYADTLH